MSLALKKLACVSRGRVQREGATMQFMTHDHLRSSSAAFQALTGLLPAEFDRLVADLEPRHDESRRARLARPDRRRAPGGGHPFKLSFPDRVLVTLTALRCRIPLNRLL